MRHKPDGRGTRAPDRPVGGIKIDSFQPFDIGAPGRHTGLVANAEESAIKLLLRQRRIVANAIAQTPEGQELARLDGALRALGVDPTDTSPPARRQSAEDSVRSLVQRLLDEDPERVWTYDEVINTYAERGRPIKAKDAKAALRTAVWALQKDQEAIRRDDGSFQSAKSHPLQSGVGGT
jgi:hypothetical protein